MHLLFRVFLLLEVCLKISLVYCQQNKTTKITTKGSFLRKPANCNHTECEATAEKYCLCAEFKYRNHSSNWPLPKKDTCLSIGCLLSGNNCYCQYGYPDENQQFCDCNEINCNNTECAREAFSSYCYCYFGDKVIVTQDMPKSKNCSDLLSEIGDHQGRYQCSGFSCKCDIYGDCVCMPPKNTNPQAPKPKQCNFQQCKKRSFEFCQCTPFACS